jgi:hypothetical protein
MVEKSMNPPITKSINENDFQRPKSLIRKIKLNQNDESMNDVINDSIDDSTNQPINEKDFKFVKWIIRQSKLIQNRSLNHSMQFTPFVRISRHLTSLRTSLQKAKSTDFIGE